MLGLKPFHFPWHIIFYVPNKLTKSIIFHFPSSYFSREAANIPLQQIPYYAQTTPTTQQKGRPRKRKPLQNDETIINTSGDGLPSEHLHENRLGEFHVGNFIFIHHEVHTKNFFYLWNSLSFKKTWCYYDTQLCMTESKTKETDDTYLYCDVGT